MVNMVMVIIMIVVVRVFTRAEFHRLIVVFFDSFYGPCTVGLDGQDGHGGQGIQDGRGDYSDCDGQSCLFLPGAEFHLLVVVFFDSFYDVRVLFALMVKMVIVHGGQGIQNGCGDCSDYNCFTRGRVSHRSAATGQGAEKRHKP